MKKILLVIISTLILSMMTGCTYNRIGEKSPHVIENNKVTITVKENTLTASKATFIIKNKTDKEITYGEPYHLEIEHDGSWHVYKLNPNTDLFFTMPSFSLKSKQSVEKEYTWNQDGYGKLKKGNYRLVISISHEKEEQYIAGEFTIK